MPSMRDLKRHHGSKRRICATPDEYEHRDTSDQDICEQSLAARRRPS